MKFPYHRFFVSLLFLISPLSATYIIFDIDKLEKTQLEAVFNVILRYEPPRVFYELAEVEVKEEISKIAPNIHVKWVPPMVWQLIALHAFFHDQTIHDAILDCSDPWWGALNYEALLHQRLAFAYSMQEIVQCFDEQSLLIPGLCELFFHINQATVSLFQRSEGSYRKMMQIAIAELPPFETWPGTSFPFWQTPWLSDTNSAELFFKALQDEELMEKLLHVEQTAHENGEWVLYRGYPGLGYPSTLQNKKDSGHALSFGSTLLGGTFYSLGSTALTYASTLDPGDYSFLALRVTPLELKELFRVGPLHPFIQLLVDGEMFHAHTKIAASHATEYSQKPLDGYFMHCNQHCIDPVGYVLKLDATPQELETEFQKICQRSSHLFSK